MYAIMSRVGAVSSARVVLWLWCAEPLKEETV